MLGAGSGDGLEPGDHRSHRTELKLDGGQIEAKDLLSWELMERPRDLSSCGAGPLRASVHLKLKGGREGGNESS